MGKKETDFLFFLPTNVTFQFIDAMKINFTRTETIGDFTVA